MVTGGNSRRPAPPRIAWDLLDDPVSCSSRQHRQPETEPLRALGQLRRDARRREMKDVDSLNDEWASRGVALRPTRSDPGTVKRNTPVEGHTLPKAAARPFDDVGLTIRFE